jgi:hypothetical protein
MSTIGSPVDQIAALLSSAGVPAEAAGTPGFARFRPLLEGLLRA